MECPWVARFWAKVDVQEEAECWEWQGAINSQGYGSFNIGSRSHQAHRIAWTLENGPPPSSHGKVAVVVRHRCDNRKCCNPSHLELGSQFQNVQDRNERGRSRGGSQSGPRNPMHFTNSGPGSKGFAAMDARRKIPLSDYPAINKSDRTLKSLADEYGVSIQSIHRIKRMSAKEAFERSLNSNLRGAP